MLRRVGLAWLALMAGLVVGPPAAAADVVAEQLDAAHTGVSAQGLGPPLRERWRWVFDPDVPISHEVRWPLVAGGRVFITFQDRHGRPGQLYALDPATGAPLWHREVSGWLSAAAYDSGKVLLASQDTVYAFDAATGTPDEWSCTNHPDAFALELCADGSQLLASTFVGGAGYEEGLGIAVDAGGPRARESGDGSTVRAQRPRAAGATTA